MFHSFISDRRREHRNYLKLVNPIIGCTPLYAATWKGLDEIVELLLRQVQILIWQQMVKLL